MRLPSVSRIRTWVLAGIERLWSQLAPARLRRRAERGDERILVLAGTQGVAQNRSSSRRWSAPNARGPRYRGARYGIGGRAGAPAWPRCPVASFLAKELP